MNGISFELAVYVCVCVCSIKQVLLNRIFLRMLKRTLKEKSKRKVNDVKWIPGRQD